MCATAARCVALRRVAARRTECSGCGKRACHPVASDASLARHMQLRPIRQTSWAAGLLASTRLIGYRAHGDFLHYRKLAKSVGPCGLGSVDNGSRRSSAPKVNTYGKGCNTSQIELFQRSSVFCKKGCIIKWSTMVKLFTKSLNPEVR